MHKYYIEKIIATRDSDKITKLADILIDTITYMKTLDHKEYEDIECELYEIAEGKVLNEEKAKHIIENMKPYGLHWTFDESEKIRKENGYTNIKPIDFWVVINSAYNDYHSIFDENTEMYAKYSYHFINDEDANEDKIYEYFVIIPKK